MMNTAPLIQLRPYMPEDYLLLSQWWKIHGWEPIPSMILPQCGVIVESVEEEERTPIAASFLYLEISAKFCIMEWTLSNPDASGRMVVRAIDALANYFSSYAKERGYAVMMTTCKQPSLARLLEKANFTKTDQGMIHLAKIL